ncbi:MurR/RpiR family transcriptional regulator [Paenibacillus thermotolerans]|uniref:MurR/RpiR family transcriptional regulator n=1 Tax=Paenibacillus thermotolerans TaxID=3027807 RepID=UPI0023689AE8|nr:MULTISPECIES: MurR/RpiR family transcriptional regulator [unclassified Paenibacillus]
MSSILRAVEERTDRLYRKEKTLAEFIAAHPHEVTRMGITELAERSGASTATITRFCKSLHFSGFTEFKLKLAEQLALQTGDETTYQDIVAGNPLQSIVAAIEANHVRSITDTTRLIDFTMLQKAISLLTKAGQIDLYGVATSGIVAQDFGQKLVRIGKRAFATSDPHMQITSASGLRPGDVAIAISYSGETPETIDALRCAKEQGAATISLTKYGSNTLASISDVQLFASSLEEGMRRGDLASRIALLHVVDILFIGMVSENFDDYVPRLEQSYQSVKKFRKKKGKIR